MLKSERSALILKHLEQHGVVRIRDLAMALQVSEMSIRRDLMELEEAGQVRRVRGGAVLNKATSPEVHHPPYVRRIAEAAARLLPGAGVFFLGPGAITSELIPLLMTAPHLTLITNALDIAWRVSQHPQHSLYVLGGEVQQRFTTDARHLPGLSIDWAIVEANGLDAARGLMMEHKSIASVTRAIFKQAAQKMVLISPERLGFTAGEFVAPIEMLDVLVTGREASTAALWDLSEAGLRFVLA